MKETIGFISDKTNQEAASQLMSWCKKNIKNITFVNVNKNKNAKSILDNADNAIKALYAKKITRLITLDDYGIAAFMYISKFYDIVVAEISDEHSAHMTMEHNNATVLSFGTKITTLHQIKNMLKSYCATKYEGSRHKVRIDMMNELAKGVK
ncbi:MAG: RpiB/LacA/LacB family sugar-phosphate isomerase [Malacoplasma sp.]|nr:RpiB/LacA/LacB family sugar-phosphate isomerase [Malacoplasma sp.]